MKRFLVVLLLLLSGGMASAQNDTVALPDAVADSDAYAFEEYTAPRRNPLRYFGSPFADHYCEARLMIGSCDNALGVAYTYLPEVWGGHFSAMWGLNCYWLTGGADLRLSKPWSDYDWHLFGSVGAGQDRFDRRWHPMGEVGVRMGAPSNPDRFGHLSGSLSVCLTDEGWAVVCGLSITLTGFILLFY